MSKVERAETPELQQIRRFRDWLADHMGISQERKEEIYIEVSRSATLRDVAYWLQVLFAAGIATLGLVLNSPAVIIGAMLISPLMGPILANGLALASGDVILGVRAIINLALSCLLAVSFAVLLVGLLPFKEVTAEIAARTNPNTLDLVVALFSGAIGSIAICKEVKGVVTSIPGVAIAVALMPPLCVAGYGIGVAVSLSGAEGIRIARGGALLFLTNLVAITFTAMLVFLALHIDTDRVRERVREWGAKDRESALIRNLLGRLPASEGLRRIGNLPGRLLLIFIPIMLILIPLSQSFSQLRQEIILKRQENQIRQTATDLWQQNFATLPNGQPRSYISRLSTTDQDGKLMLDLRVVTSSPCTSGERSEYTRLLASRLQRPDESVVLQLIEIPTASSELLAKAREERRTEAAPTVPRLQVSFLQAVSSALAGLRLPPPARIIDYEVATSLGEPLQVKLIYMSDRDIDADAQSLIVDDVRSRFNYPDAEVRLERIEASLAPLVFGRNQTAFTTGIAALLDQAGQALRRHPSLSVEINASEDRAERKGIAEERARAIAEHLTSRWQVSPERISINPGAILQRGVILKMSIPETSR